MKFTEYADRDMLMLGLANILAGSLTSALTRQGRATLVVPGGSTPGPVFDYLSATDLDWGNVRVMLSDERWLPETSARSNTALLKQRLLVGHAAAATLIPLYADAPQPEDMLERLTTAVADCLPIDVMLLGIGTDMHTASLFPGADQLAAALDTAAPPLMAMRAPGAPEPRITLSAPILSGSLDKHIVITGPEKRAAFEQAKATSDPLQAPITAVWANATVHWAA